MYAAKKWWVMLLTTVVTSWWQYSTFFVQDLHTLPYCVQFLHTSQADCASHLPTHTRTHQPTHTHTHMQSVCWWLVIACLALTHGQGLYPCFCCLVVMVAAQPVEWSLVNLAHKWGTVHLVINEQCSSGSSKTLHLADEAQKGRNSCLRFEFC